jgi:signal transduction histidine kinase
MGSRDKKRNKRSADSSTSDTPSTECQEDTNKRHSALLTLSRISAAVSGLADLDAVLEVALDTVLEVMNGNVGGILLVDEQTGTLSYRVYRGLSQQYVEKMHLKIGEGIAGRVAQSGKAVLLEDISTDPRAAMQDLINTEGLKAFISVPLRARDTVLGVLNVTSREPHHFTKPDMHLLHAIGDEVGVAIEQSKLYEWLRKERENYRRLARYMLIAQEVERGRVARELHDETTQSLTGLSLNMKALLSIANTHDYGDAEFKAKLEKCYEITLQLNSEINSIMKSLRPTALDSLGLVPAINQYAQSRLQSTEINVRIQHEGMEKRLPSEVEFALYRIFQGAISNVAWHSQAQNVVISILCTSNEVIMQIEDDGRGFDASKPIEVDESGRGRGLFSMKERSSLISGTCDIQSKPGQGTRITVKVPVYWSEVDAQDKVADSG